MEPMLEENVAVCCIPIVGPLGGRRGVWFCQVAAPPRSFSLPAQYSNHYNNLKTFWFEFEYS